MSAHILDGRAVQRQLLEKAAAAIAEAGITPEVALISVAGSDPMVSVNMRLHRRTFQRTGMRVRSIELPADTTQQALTGLIERLNDDNEVDVIMTLMPLPAHLDIRAVLAAIAPEKEAEGLHPAHAARLSPISVLPPSRLPVVPMAVLHLLGQVDFNPSGMQLVVLTDPDITETNPVAKLVARVAAFAALPPDAAGANVPLSHPRAAGLTRAADLLIVSVQQPRVVTGDWIKPGAVVIDFNPICEGMEPHPRAPGRLVPRLAGGVDTESALRVARALAPIPGGVGPAMLGVLADQIVTVALERTVRPAQAA